jgi:hypothetical protein
VRPVLGRQPQRVNDDRVAPAHQPDRLGMHPRQSRQYCGHWSARCGWVITLLTSQAEATEIAGLLRWGQTSS